MFPAEGKLSVKIYCYIYQNSEIYNWMLGKDKEIKWTTEAKQSFEDIKKAISEVLVLASPDFSKDFLIFSFSSKHTMAGLLL